MPLRYGGNTRRPLRLGPGRPAIEIQLVRLVAGDYSRDIGTLGYIESAMRCDCVWVHWVGGGGSGPIRLADLEGIGTLLVAIPQSTEPNGNST